VATHERENFCWDFGLSREEVKDLRLFVLGRIKAIRNGKE
jgi:hypothetical protein